MSIRAALKPPLIAGIKKEKEKEKEKNIDFSRENSSILCRFPFYINHSIRAANPVPRLRFAADLRRGATGSSKALYERKSKLQTEALFSREKVAIKKKEIKK